ncbi:DUF4097 family beta strand repeat-containing protein [Saccharopolyspora sp. ASAGF58]|uniref:DUF4097 family beta strand repeat-containing protein n=1 Tax=Saccharopolyspora sp. ASAGF58 TaxID=2719023 RepID=UPI00143FBA5E|nr:DUF4097 family beta strand repeat-containing protein [Saccharopolyspora sp. ASAGF58]QIZ33936.1 DUF4097 domain-containing protein [Saccharopolyspora sp. ASAGF58]
MNKRIIHTELGAMTFELDMAGGQVEILLEDRERAEILLEPVVAGDEVAADVISRTRHISRGSVLDLRIPHPEPTVLGTGSTVIHQSFGHVGRGAVVTGVVIVNGQIISGNRSTRTVGGGGVKVTARLPHGSRLKATTVSANVKVNGFLPSVDFQSTSGDLAVSAVDRLRARTISGRVIATQSDDVDVDTSSGIVKIGETNTIEVHTLSSDICVDRLHGPQARLTTISGDIDLHVDVDAKVTARAMSGDIRITATRGVRVTSHATSMSGRIRTPKN